MYKRRSATREIPRPKYFFRFYIFISVQRIH
ncbi:hypothetical protein AT5A_19311 [Agrobacterium tumefaciens 5A]|nr:hypothetical protein AT5A_19311 [Agrobacterium tumefaciens 5A]